MYFYLMIEMRIIFICCLLTACSTPVQRHLPDDNLLKAYARQTELTDPGEYLHLYNGLPQSLHSLCLLIKCQLIHPMEALQMGHSMEQVISDGAIENTEQILEALMKRDSSGLSFSRKPDDRLLLACHHHAMLLTSILRSREIPARMRFGFARYYEKKAGVRFGHIICEVWDDREQRWVLADPDRQYVDFSPDRFDFSREAWVNLTKKGMDQKIYVSSIGNGLLGVVNLLAMDIAHVTLHERIHWIYPEISLREIKEVSDLNNEDRIALDEAAELLKDPDLNFSNIDSLYDFNPGFHPSDFDYEDYCRMMEERE
jgi:hypothetical protein